jgi:hypothetical protein
LPKVFEIALVVGFDPFDQSSFGGIP